MFIKFKKNKILTMAPQKEDSKIADKQSPDLILMYAYIRAVKDIIYSTKPSPQKIVAINKILKVLTLKIQNYIIDQVIINHSNSYTFRADFPKQNKSCACPSCTSNYILYAKTMPLVNSITLPIVTTPIISPTWNYNRLIENFSNISIALNNPYFYDKINHYDTIIYLPTGICVCQNGIHSTTTAVYDDYGSIVANGYINTEKWYSEIYFDGTAFYCKKCKSIITTPPCPEVGILFEIGRVLIENKLSMITINSLNT